MGDGVKGVEQGCNGSPVGTRNLLERVEELGILGLRIPEEVVKCPLVTRELQSG